MGAIVASQRGAFAVPGLSCCDQWPLLRGSETTVRVAFAAWTQAVRTDSREHRDVPSARSRRRAKRMARMALRRERALGLVGT